MKKALVYLLIFATLPAVAQYPRQNTHGNKSNMSTWMSVTAPRHQTFWLFIDDVLQNERAVHSIRVDNLWPDKFYIRVELDNTDHNCVGRFLDLKTSNSYSIEEHRGHYSLETAPSQPNADYETNYRSGVTDDMHPMSPVPPSTPEEFTIPMPSFSDQGMSSRDFEEAYAMIKKESSDNTRLSIAKQVVTTNPMTAAQIMKVAKLFSFENNKLEFAKYAYKYCVDKKKYFLLNDAFEQDSSKHDLIEFIQKKSL